MTTEAGRRLLSELSENPLPGARYAHDVVEARLSVVETQAAEAERARLREAFALVSKTSIRDGSPSGKFVVDWLDVLDLLSESRP